jgi:hypothetical protein
MEFPCPQNNENPFEDLLSFPLYKTPRVIIMVVPVINKKKYTQSENRRFWYPNQRTIYQKAPK